MFDLGLILNPNQRIFILSRILMIKNKVFFVTSKSDCPQHLPYNFHISKLSRLRRHIYYLKKNKPSTLKSKIKPYSLIFKQINFELLTVFYTVVILGSVSKTAKKLSVSQPAISLALRKIEKETGALLFRQLNSKKLIVLTPQGLMLFNHIQRLFNIIDESLEFSNFLISGIKSNNLLQFKLKNLSFFPLYNINKNLLFYSAKKNLISNHFLNNYFIDFNQLNFKYFENESRFIIVKGKLISKELSYNIKNEADKFFWLDKFSSLTKFNIKDFSYLSNTNIIEIQTKTAFTICIEMKISNFIFWGSEI